MARIAYIENGIVVNIVMAEIDDEHPENVTPVDCPTVEYGPAIGWAYQGGTFQAPPVHIPTSVIWDAIKAERDRRKAGGVQVKVGGVNKWFHSDDASRIQQMGLVMMGANIPAGLQWKTMDGTFVAMNQTVAGNVFAAAAASDQAIFAVAEGHRVAMEASADPAAYDYSTGWPKVYGE